MLEIADRLLTAGIGGVVGGLLSAFATHKLTGHREAKSRRQHFLSFVRQWRAEVANPPVGQGGFVSGIGSPPVAAYSAKVAAFHGESELARNAFGNSADFQRLTERVANMKPTDWANQQPKEVILAAMDELLALIA